MGGAEDTLIQSTGIGRVTISCQQIGEGNASQAHAELVQEMAATQLAWVGESGATWRGHHLCVLGGVSAS